MKTIHTPHAGKLSLARVFAGTFSDGDAVYGGEADERIAGTFDVLGQEAVKRGPAKPGDTVAFGGSKASRRGIRCRPRRGLSFHRAERRARAGSGSRLPRRTRRTR